MKDWRNNWPKLAFIFVPLVIALVAGAVLTIEYLQPDTEKATRLVKESSSRKENFTVQQYLYSTIYYHRSKGEQVDIRGWRARKPTDPSGLIKVEFSYADSKGDHLAEWAVDLKHKKVTPANEVARALSWH
jgi:hypothetical protein